MCKFLISLLPLFAGAQYPTEDAVVHDFLSRPFGIDEGWLEIEDSDDVYMIPFDVTGDGEEDLLLSSSRYSTGDYDWTHWSFYAHVPSGYEPDPYGAIFSPSDIFLCEDESGISRICTLQHMSAESTIVKGFTLTDHGLDYVGIRELHNESVEDQAWIQDQIRNSPKVVETVKAGELRRKLAADGAKASEEPARPDEIAADPTGTAPAPKSNNLAGTPLSKDDVLRSFLDTVINLNDVNRPIADDTDVYVIEYDFTHDGIADLLVSASNFDTGDYDWLYWSAYRAVSGGYQDRYGGTAMSPTNLFLYEDDTGEEYLCTLHHINVESMLVKGLTSIGRRLDYVGIRELHRDSEEDQAWIQEQMRNSPKIMETVKAGELRRKLAAEATKSGEAAAEGADEPLPFAELKTAMQGIIQSSYNGISLDFTADYLEQLLFGMDDSVKKTVLAGIREGQGIEQIIQSTHGVLGWEELPDMVNDSEMEHNRGIRDDRMSDEEWRADANKVVIFYKAHAMGDGRMLYLFQNTYMAITKKWARESTPPYTILETSGARPIIADIYVDRLAYNLAGRVSAGDVWRPLGFLPGESGAMPDILIYRGPGGMVLNFTVYLYAWNPDYWVWEGAELWGHEGIPNFEYNGSTFEITSGSETENLRESALKNAEFLAEQAGPPSPLSPPKEKYVKRPEPSTQPAEVR